jgi:putative ABC transport system permease protein
MGRSPAFSAVAILTLAVAIGGNTAIFSLINALALKPLPVPAPQEIARVHSGENRMSWPNYQDIQQRNRVFSDVAAHNGATLTLTTEDASIRLTGEVASSNYLVMLGVPPMIGRTFLPNETRTDLIVLSERAWRSRFGSDPSIIGRMLTLDGRGYEVVGIMPAGFHGARPPGFVSEFWVPVDLSPSNRTLHDRSTVSYEIVGRLKSGVTFAQAQAELRVLASQMRSEYPDLRERFAEMEVFPMIGIAAFRGFTRTMLPVFTFIGLMTIAAGFVLLVGCANIAGLLLGRAAARRREIGVRLALGAGRGRLIRQLVTESLVLALIGGAAGLVLALWLSASFNGLLARLPVPIEFDLSLDRRILVYALTLSIGTTLLCSLAPARRATRLDVVPALKDDAPRGVRQGLRQSLVVGQVAISCLLLLWGGLFVRSLLNVHKVDPGFDPSGVLLADIQLDDETVRAMGMAPLIADVLSHTRALAGVESAGISTVVPLTFTGREEFKVRTDSDPREGPGRWVLSNRVSPGWFATVRIPLLAGRDISPDDRIGTPLVAVVNETLARQFWNGDAIGKRLDKFEVIGVVRDSKYWTLGETIQPTLYTSLAQRNQPVMTLHVRTSNMPAATAAIRRAAGRISPKVSVDFKPMSAAVGAAILPAQVGAVATSLLGGLAAMLAMMGVYGLVSFTVAQRTREIGIRKAIGAQTRDVVRVVARGTARPVAIGLGLGLVLGSLGARVLGGFIVGVSPIDPLTLVATAAVVIGTAGAASALPASRAARIDPLVTLKAE